MSRAARVVIIAYSEGEISEAEAARVAARGCHAKWQNKSVDARGRIDMSQNFHPWTGRPSVKLHGLPAKASGHGSGRIEDVLDVVYWSKLRANRKKAGMSEAILAKAAFCDVSQSVERPNFSQPNAPVFTTSSCIYAFEKDAVITGGH